MTKKHFAGLADVLNGLALQGALDANAHIVTVFRLAAWCETTNPRFDRDRFIMAAGLETQAGKFVSAPMGPRS